MTTKILGALAVVALGTMTVPTARADSFALNAILCNCLPAGSTDGGTVMLVKNATNTNEVDFTVTLDSGLDFHSSNAFDAFAFDYNGTATITVNVTTANFTANTTSQGASGSDGAGHNYQEFIDYSGPSVTAGNTGVSVLNFTVTGTGITLANFETVIGSGGTMHENNYYFAAAVTNPAGSSCTGVVGGGGGPAAASSGTNSNGGSCGSTTSMVPEPTSIFLLGTVLAGTAAALKRRFQSAKA